MSGGSCDICSNHRWGIPLYLFLHHNAHSQAAEYILVVLANLSGRLCLACLGCKLDFFPAQQEVLTELSEGSEKVTVQLPAGHSLLVTAKLSELDPKDPNNGRAQLRHDAQRKGVLQTGYQARLAGLLSPARLRWMSMKGQTSLTETLAGHKAIVKIYKDRFDIPYSGELSVKIKCAGTAAAGLILSSVSSPPSQGILWAVVVLFFILGAFFEARYRADSVGGDFGFLGALAAFVAFGLTPLSGWHQAALTLLQTAFIGYVVFGYSAQGIAKYWASARKSRGLSMSMDGIYAALWPLILKPQGSVPLLGIE